MAVSREYGVTRFIGLSTDQKPRIGLQIDGVTTYDAMTSLQPGSSFLESDTGRLFRWDGMAWRVAPESDNALLAALEALRFEVAALRLGMIEAGNCKEVSERDVRSEMAVA